MTLTKKKKKNSLFSYMAAGLLLYDTFVNISGLLIMT